MENYTETISRRKKEESSRPTTHSVRRVEFYRSKDRSRSDRFTLISSLSKVISKRALMISRVPCAWSRETSAGGSL